MFIIRARYEGSYMEMRNS